MNKAIFIDEKLSQTTDLLRHLVDNSDQIPLILGEPGTGKSTLRRHLTELAADKWELCQVDSTPMLQPDQLLAHLGRCFGVSDQNPALEKIVQHLENLTVRGRLPIILVDDAHQLPVATIVMLLQLYERHANEQLQVKIVLFALPQIDLLLKTPQIQYMDLQMIQALDLAPMSKNRVERFIQFLHQQMDLEGSHEITQGELNGIYRASGGNQGRVVSELHQLLQRVSEPNLRKHGALSLLADLSAPVVIGLVVMAALILATVVFQDDINALLEQRKLVKAPPKETIETEIETVYSDQSATVPAVPEKQPEPPEIIEPLPDPIPNRSLDQVPIPELEQVEEESAISQKETLEVIPKPMISEVPVKTSAETTDTKTIPSLAGDHAPSQEKETLPETGTIGEDSSATIEAVSKLKKGEIEVQLQHQLPGNSTQAEKSDHLSTATAQPDKPATKPKPPLREAWLLEQDPTSYTLQVVGLQSEGGLRQYIGKNKLSGKVAYFRTKKSGLPWFSVLFGIYPDKGSAIAAIKTLPKALQKNDVWPRRLSSIQKQMQIK